MSWLRGGALIVVSLLTVFPVVGLRAQEGGTAVDVLIRSSVKIVACYDVPADAGPGSVTIQAFSQCRSGSGGSGTIIDADGTVLTNAHVALTDTGEPSWLLIGETVDPRAFPRWAYIGRATVHDARVDLAIVEPVYDLDGSALTAGEVQLRPLAVATDRNSVDLADPIWMVGYPGVGGAYVTHLPAEVVGFDADPDNNELSPGWIKISPAPAPGNSGGTVVDVAGVLVAVPTKGGAGEIRCADLDGDGIIDPGGGECISMTSDVGRVRPLPEGYDLMMARSGGEAPGPPSPTAESVVVVGSFVSADTDDPIANAYFAVAQAGISWDEYRQRSGRGEQAEVLLTYGWSDEVGQFQLNDPVPTGQEYTVIYGAEGFPIGHTEGWSIAPGSPSPHELEPIRLAAGR